MSWRIVVISNCAKLDYKMDYMLVRQDTITKIHLSEIQLLMIESTAVSLTASLLCELTKRKIKVIFCDEKRNPSSELIGYYGSHDTSAKVRKQIQWSSEAKKLIWTEIVSEKIALNYGYSLILSMVNREITANGYLTQLGLFHDNMFNHFNLGSDLMEPFRILIDRKVYQNLPDQFEHEEKMQIVDVLNENVIIDGKRNYVSNAIKIYCRSVFEAIDENDVSLLRFYMRIIVMFDLPMKSSSDIREYNRFRKYLIKAGFLMMQESVYCKLALNTTVADGIMASVRNNKPEHGLVQAFTLTERQFSKIEYITGTSSSNVLNSDKRLVIL